MRIASLLAPLFLATVACADEGMWLLTHPPTAQLSSTYGFAPSPAWLEHLQKSAVRFSTGGSGSLVSRQGLVMTNHHVGSDMLAALSSKDRDLLAEGFAAASHADELPCPDLALDILWSIEDVTSKVVDAAKGATDDAAAGQARLAAIAELEAASEKATGLKSEVVTLFQGGQYHLYRYKRFTDVRLVFAPEQDIAFFGGDTDNFEFPRYNLDCCFFRIYENGAPLVAEHYLTWSEAGAQEGELTFVVGHPGRTQRLFTDAHVRFLRDVELPWMLARNWREEMKMQAFAQRNAENLRIATEDLHGIANGRKARTGLLEGLQDPSLMASKKANEDRILAAIAKDPALAPLGAAWNRVEKAQAVHREIFEVRHLFEEGWRGPRVARVARQLLRFAEESTKPNAERLREYTDARRDTLERSILSPEPFYPAIESEWLAIKLSFLAERLGAEHALVRTLLNGASPRERAEAIVRETKLFDREVRKQLFAGGAKAIAEAKDPMIDFMKAIDGEARAVRQRYETEVEAVERSAYADIAKAVFAVDGDKTYPDATFTLRLAYGTVKGWKEGGAMIEPFTNFAGLYRRADERRGQAEFVLPQRWIDACEKLDKSIPFNFVSTADIIGGNSGSPVVNAKGEVVGLIFDGNLQSLVGDVIYDGDVNRAVAVDSRGLLASLEVVYNATSLVQEIRGGEIRGGEIRGRDTRSK